MTLCCCCFLVCEVSCFFSHNWRPMCWIFTVHELRWKCSFSSWLQFLWLHRSCNDLVKKMAVCEYVSIFRQRHLERNRYIYAFFVCEKELGQQDVVTVWVCDGVAECVRAFVVWRVCCPTHHQQWEQRRQPPQQQSQQQPREQRQRQRGRAHRRADPGPAHRFPR